MLHPYRQLSRREIVGVACGALLLAAVRPTHADGFRSPGGCFIAPEQFAGITVYNGPPRQHAENIDPSREPIIGSSGDQSFDQALGRVLVKISHGLSVVPGFAYYDDSAGKNALAAPVKRVPGTRGTVLFGLA